MESPSKNACQLKQSADFFAALYIHSFTKQHWSENSQFEALKLSKNKWENLGENKRDTIVNRDINRDVWFSDLELFQI